MSEKKKISAKQITADIRSGMTDGQLMEKHGLTAKALETVKGKLLASGLVTRGELDRRTGNVT
jgi:hypothetical protein